jgi:hypothetical protein
MGSHKNKFEGMTVHRRKICIKIINEGINK